MCGDQYISLSASASEVFVILALHKLDYYYYYQLLVCKTNSKNIHNSYSECPRFWRYLSKSFMCVIKCYLYAVRVCNVYFIDATPYSF